MSRDDAWEAIIDETLAQLGPMVGKAEAAAALGVSERTLRRMVARSVISVGRTTGGHLRVPRAELRRVLLARGPSSAVVDEDGDEWQEFEIIVDEAAMAEEVRRYGRDAFPPWS